MKSSADISSASEAVTPTPDYSPPSFHCPQGPIRKSPSFRIATPKHEETPVSSMFSICLTCIIAYHSFQDFLKGADPVKLANAKLQSDPGSAALKLMDCVFTIKELVNGNPSGVTKSKDSARQKTIRPLNAAKMKYIDGMCSYNTTKHCYAVLQC